MTGSQRTNRIMIELAERLEPGADTREQRLREAGCDERKPGP
jgi:hypothetical protein